MCVWKICALNRKAIITTLQMESCQNPLCLIHVLKICPNPQRMFEPCMSHGCIKDMSEISTSHNVFKLCPNPLHLIHLLKLCPNPAHLIPVLQICPNPPRLIYILNMCLNTLHLILY